MCVQKKKKKLLFCGNRELVTLQFCMKTYLPAYIGAYL